MNLGTFLVIINLHNNALIGINEDFGSCCRGIKAYYEISMTEIVVKIVFHLLFKVPRLTETALRNFDQDIPVRQIVDRVYSNP